MSPADSFGHGSAHGVVVAWGHGPIRFSRKYRVPTVLRTGPYRFYFYSHEPNEPPHVHVDRGRATAKFWLDPVNLASSVGFKSHELTTLLGIVRRRQWEFRDAWHRFFS